jgi:lipopolysaccharide/colanic/teichoic acid biosynthesis glycosyltransferase
MYQRFIKRPIDVALSLAILIFLSPVCFIVTLLIKLDNPGHILFSQKRTGLNGCDFVMYKFRTMTESNDVLDHTKENQLTRAGKLIRAFSLDEIPQVINILKGEMSFIGPRPWITPYYDHMNDEQRLRVSVKPGITGLAQVHGRNSLTIHQKIDFDLGYVKRISLREDLKIIYLTISTLFDKGSREIEKLGIHQEIELLQNQKEILGH